MAEKKRSTSSLELNALKKKITTADKLVEYKREKTTEAVRR